ncbi:MAG: nitrate- and nitrite sensing domain-containing protein [Jannaschia sp.]
MHRIRSLTVTQSMAVIFLSGFTIAFVFALVSIITDLRRHSAMLQDHDLLVLTQDVGALVHEMQMERGLTTTWLANPERGLRRAIEAQRDLVDAILKPLAARSIAEDAAEASIAEPDLFGTLPDWLVNHRADIDGKGLTSRDYRVLTTAKHKEVIAAVASAASRARSVRLALLIRNSASLMAAKDAVGLERALGGAITATIAANRDVPEELRADLRIEIGIRKTRLDAFRLIADEGMRTSLELWARSSRAARFEDLRDSLLGPAPDKAAGDASNVTRQVGSVAAWFEIADALINELRTMEEEGDARLFTALERETDASRTFILRELTLFALLFSVFGSLAWATLVGVNRSIRQIICVIRRLSVDAQTTRIPQCPQADLNQISAALSVLRTVQLDKTRQLQAAEDVRHRVDADVDNVLAAAASGDKDKRVDLLGLDAPTAVMARGINHLLDRIESERTTSV